MRDADCQSPKLAIVETYMGGYNIDWKYYFVNI